MVPRASAPPRSRMTFDWTPDNVVNAAGGLVVVAFGFLVIALGARGPAARGFFLFAVGFGGGVALRNTGDAALASPSVALACFVAGALLWLLATVGIVRLGLVFPRRVGRDERKALVVAGATFCVSLPFIPLFVLAGWDALKRGDLPASGFMFYTASAGAGLAAMLGLLVLLPLRMRAASPSERAQLVLLAAALLPYVAYTTGLLFLEPALSKLIGTIWLMILAGIVIAWLAQTAADRAPKASRAIAWVTLTMILVGMIEGVFFGVTTRSNLSSISGIIRIVAVALLAYAVIRHQLLGIDVKIRWTISKSTIAAAFIGVFFVASEGAQQFFGETLGSSYVGIAAAGMLVFAMAPLQRAAERLAVKAVPIPNSAPTQPAPNTDNEAVYVNALRLALRDKRLSRAEEAHLHRLAEALGIRPGRAHELLAEVENDLGAPSS